MLNFEKKFEKLLNTISKNAQTNKTNLLVDVVVCLSENGYFLHELVGAVFQPLHVALKFGAVRPLN